MRIMLLVYACVTHIWFNNCNSNSKQLTIVFGRII